MHEPAVRLRRVADRTRAERARDRVPVQAEPQVPCFPVPVDGCPRPVDRSRTANAFRRRAREPDSNLSSILIHGTGSVRSRLGHG